MSFSNLRHLLSAQPGECLPVSGFHCCGGFASGFLVGQASRPGLHIRVSDQGLGNVLWHCVNDKANITTVFTPGIIIGLCFISPILAVVQLYHMWV